MIAANLLKSFHYRTHNNEVLPGVDDGWINNVNTAWIQPVGSIFRVRISTVRGIPTSTLDAQFRMVYSKKPVGGSFGSFTAVGLSTSNVRIATSGLYDDDDDCLDLFLSINADLIGAPNGQYNTQPGTSLTGISSWPNAPIFGVETEYAVELVSGDVEDGDQIRFKLQIKGGVEFTFVASNVPTLTVVTHQAPDGSGFMGPAVGGSAFVGPTADGDGFMGMTADGAGALGATVGGRGFLGSKTDGSGAIKRKDN